MKSRIAPRILAIPLFVALLAAPAVFQEGLISFWASWGLPLLAALALFGVGLALIFGAPPLARAFNRPSRSEDGDSGISEDAQDEQPAEVEDESEKELDIALGDALSELQPENFMDLATALQEMGRHADTLEVLAQVLERKGIASRAEVAQTLRRMRLNMRQDDSRSA